MRRGSPRTPASRGLRDRQPESAPLRVFRIASELADDPADLNEVRDSRGGSEGEETLGLPDVVIIDATHTGQAAAHLIGSHDRVEIRASRIHRYGATRADDREPHGPSDPELECVVTRPEDARGLRLNGCGAGRLLNLRSDRQ